MSVLVTGSVAIDHIMVFDDEFKNHILPDKVHMLNVAFLVPSLDKVWGGTGANIAYNLRILDVDPILLATVGSDFGAYASWMDQHGMRRDWIRVLDDSFTAQAFITTDLAHNQLIAFHPGAMDRAHEASIDGVAEQVSVGIVAPNGKQAMIDHAAALKAKGIPAVIDPGQGLPMFDGPELLELMDGAAVYVVNDYEWQLTQERTGLDEDGIAERVGAVVMTKGAEGSAVRRGAKPGQVQLESDRSEIPAVAVEKVVDPTGCGDAYRAGLLYAIQQGLPLETGARIGTLLASMKVQKQGPQSLDLSPAAFRASFEREYGQSF